MNITQAQLDSLCQLAKAAGHEIMDVYQGQIDTWQKEDNSPLTQADLRADKTIRSGLEMHFPHVFILSEESRSAEQDTIPDTLFLVDPLDGTKEFLKRNDEFTVNIALVHQGRVMAGVVFAPALNELFYAAQGLGCWKEDSIGKLQLTIAPRDDTKPLRIIGSRSHGSDQLNDWLETLNQPYTLMTAGSSLKFCRVADGQADIYPRFGLTCQWDTAAAQCIVEQAGGSVLNLNANSLSYGLARPLLNPFFIASAAKKI
jgi:3'(2'), 5'-bisphosphate nucleotidase